MLKKANNIEIEDKNKIDYENLKRLGVKMFPRKLIEDSREGLVRHSSNRVARAIYYWFRKEHRLEKGWHVHRSNNEIKECAV